MKRKAKLLEAIALLRELVDDDPQAWGKCRWCGRTGAVHDPGCLWRRADELLRSP